MLQTGRRLILVGRLLAAAASALATHVDGRILAPSHTQIECTRNNPRCRLWRRGPRPWAWRRGRAVVVRCRLWRQHLQELHDTHHDDVLVVHGRRLLGADLPR
jgi:hypothetical protein